LKLLHIFITCSTIFFVGSSGAWSQASNEEELASCAREAAVKALSEAKGLNSEDVEVLISRASENKPETISRFYKIPNDSEVLKVIDLAAKDDTAYSIMADGLSGCYNVYYSSVGKKAESPIESSVAAKQCGPICTFEFWNNASQDDLTRNIAQVEATSYDEKGRTLIHYAATYDSADHIKTLVSRGGNINAKDTDGKTPLMVSARQRSPRALEYLLSIGANPNSQDNDGWSPLMYALGYDRAVEALLKAGADVNASTIYSQTSLMIASLRGNLSDVKALLKVGAEVNVKDGVEGYTPLMSAALANQDSEELIITLLDAGAKTDYLSNKNETALDIAIRLGHDNKALALNPSLVSAEEKTPDQFGSSSFSSLSIMGISVGEQKPQNCSPRQGIFSRNFGLEEFKAFTCTITVDGETIELLLNGIDKPEEIIKVQRRQIFRNFDAFTIGDAAVSHYSDAGSSYKTFELPNFTTHEWESKNGHPSKLGLKVGFCSDPNLNFRCNGVTYIEYSAKAKDLEKIFDVLVKASKAKQKF